MLYITGDINYTDGFFDTGFGIGSQIVKGTNPFKHINQEKNDIWFGNLECVIAQQSNKTGIYRKQFIIDPIFLKQIHHFNIYNVANNHVMQHGDEAYSEMLSYLENSQLMFVGANNKRTIELNEQGKKIGILSFSQREEKYSKNPQYWYNPDYIEIEAEFSKIQNLDYKIVYIHWGNEFINRPYVDQKKFAHWLVDIGFDLVVGVHPHVLQGYEIYKNKHIFYSLGNFLFNMPLESTRYSIVLKINLSSPNIVVGFDYIHMGKDNLPVLIKSNETPYNYRFEYLNNQLKIENENELYYSSVFSFRKKYRLSNYKTLIKNILKFRFTDILSILFDFIKRKLI